MLGPDESDEMDGEAGRDVMDGCGGCGGDCAVSRGGVERCICGGGDECDSGRGFADLCDWGWDVS